MMGQANRQTLGDRVFDLGNTIFLLFCFLLALYPLLYVLSCSLSSPFSLMANKVWLYPVDFSLEGYRAVFKTNQVWLGYRNSILYTVVGTSVNIVFTVMCAYPLSRRDLWGRNAVMLYITFTMLFNGGLIPTFLLVKSLGIYNTFWALVIPNAMSVWNVIISRTYFQTTIPQELLEASQLDGCTNTRFIWHVVLPLSKPILAVIALFYAVEHWNAFFNALIYLNNEKLYPLTIILRNILIQNQNYDSMISDVADLERRQYLSELLKYSLIIIASVPVLAIYPFVQKYFVKGIMIGAIKG